MTLMYLSYVVQVALNSQTILSAFLSVLMLQSVNSMKTLIDVVL